MTLTIGLVANVYNECNALPGWLETHMPYFDDVRVVHAGPQGRLSDDGTIELLEKWRIPTLFCPIDDGFGVVRTRAVHSSPCDYVMVLDADERFYPLHRLMSCRGDGTPQRRVDEILDQYNPRGGRVIDWNLMSQLGAALRVQVEEPYDQGQLLRDLLERDRPDALCTIRRHWHDIGMRHPTQNWHSDPDWQARVVRRDSDIYFDPSVRMHEQLVGVQKLTRAEMHWGPFFDHFHFLFKRMEEAQREYDVAIYDAISEGRTPPVKAGSEDVTVLLHGLDASGSVGLDMSLGCTMCERAAAYIRKNR